MRNACLILLVLGVAGCDASRDEKAKDAPKDSAKILLDPSLPEWREKAPDSFKAKLATSKGDIVILVERAWAPLGADRFHALVKYGYFDGVRFFRVIDGFMAQFGIHGKPELNRVWSEASIKDDPVVKSNKRGWVTFATRGRDTRTTQLFINYSDRNSMLDGQGFSPFGQVIEGMDVADRLYNGYGECFPGGRGPDQTKIQAQGNAYLDREFKELDYIKTARII